MNIKGTVTRIFAEKESGFKILAVSVRDIRSIPPDKRNPDFPGSVTLIGVMKGVQVDYVIEASGEWENRQSGSYWPWQFKVSDYAICEFETPIQPFESLEELMKQNEQMFSDNGIENEKMIASFELSSFSSDLFNRIKCLKSREQDVLLLRFGIGCKREYTLEEIGSRLHITRERVRQIENKAIRKMRYLYGLGTERKNKLKK